MSTTKRLRIDQEDSIDSKIDSISSINNNNNNTNISSSSSTSSLYVISGVDSTAVDPIVYNDIEILKLQNNKLLKKVVELELQATNSSSNILYEQALNEKNQELNKYILENAALESKLKDADELITSLKKEIELLKNKK